MRERIGMDLYHELRMRKMIIVEDDTLLKDSLSAAVTVRDSYEAVKLKR